MSFVIGRWRLVHVASGVARALQAPPGRSSRRNPLARGPNKLLAGGPKIVALLLDAFRQQTFNPRIIQLYSAII